MSTEKAAEKLVRADAVTTPDRIRPRRLRRNALIRNLVAETRITADQMIMPHFILPAAKGREAIASMPGIARLGIEDLVRQAEADRALGIRTVLLFGLPGEHEKDPFGTAASDPHGTVPEACRALKKAFGKDLLVITDVCLCAYTDHGHCGVIVEDDVDNDRSLERLAAMAVAHAAAGADIVAPSDMMDGRVAAIRDALDDAGLATTGLLSYSVKYASGYYGPFREAADSAPGKGDRQGYQMDPRNVREAVKEALLDEAEGADMLMVKPALAYLDVIAAVRAVSDLPLTAYNVSAEYSMVKAAAKLGWVDEPRIVRENLWAMIRAGADAVITYHAREVLKEKWL
jgi:porphobilinogen synthase